ncbi:hypothetical protein D9B61_24105 [Serratia marcescens]|nr:hypothetical protein D9B61_24105 [Serratia marcescens]
MTRLTMLPDLTPPAYKNKENQFIDFRLIITKGEKPRFFPLCQQSDAGGFSRVLPPNTPPCLPPAHLYLYILFYSF